MFVNGVERRIAKEGVSLTLTTDRFVTNKQENLQLAFQCRSKPQILLIIYFVYNTVSVAPTFLTRVESEAQLHFEALLLTKCVWLTMHHWLNLTHSKTCLAH